MRGILILFTLIGLLAFVDANAANVSLTWTPTPSSNATGYYILYGTNSGSYYGAVPVLSSTTTNVTITGLVSGMTYYFAAESFNSAWQVSQPSSQISGIAGSSTSSAASGLTSALMSSAGQFGFNFSGPGSGQYIVQASTDLVNWVNLLTNTSASFNFVDSNATQFHKRFYRVAYLPSN